MTITEIHQPRDLARIRRIALAAQGLHKTQPFGSGLVGARKAINHIGYVQIDTISVVERAHHHVLYSRVPKFKPAMMDKMLVNRDIFEYWTHAAAFIPMRDFRFSLPYKHAIKNGQTHWYKVRDKKLMKELIARIRADGPLRSRDIETDTRKRDGWWDLKPAKKALEQLYMEGELMVTNREGFQKAYDLTERVVPSHINSQTPSVEEFANHLIDQQLRCHGLVSLKGITYLRRITDLKKTVKNLINERFAQGELEQVRVGDGEPFFIKAGELDGPLPKISNRLLILSPFDNSVIQRERLRALFEFDYQIECYVPATKRQYGYFSLPLLYGDDFIGRMDCKAHRKTRHLEIKHLHFEPHQFETRHFKNSAVIAALVDAVAQFIGFQGCDTVALKQVSPKSIHKPLQRAFEALC